MLFDLLPVLSPSDSADIDRSGRDGRSNSLVLVHIQVEAYMFTLLKPLASLRYATRAE